MKNILPNQPLPLFPLILKTLSSYLKIFPHVFWLVVFSSVGHLVIPFLVKENLAYASVAMVGFIFLTWFLFTAIIAKAKTILLGGDMQFSEALRIAKRRYLWVLSSNVIFFAIGAFVMLVIFTLNRIFDLISLHPFYLVLSIIISVVIFVYLYFAIPEIALENKPAFPAFKASVRLVRHHWWRTFIVLALVGAAILGFEALGILFTGKDRMMLFVGYNFALQIAFYPLIITTTVLLLNDLKLRAGGYHLH